MVVLKVLKSRLNSYNGQYSALKIRMKIIFFLLFILLFPIVNSQHYDWPMWRYNHERSSSTPEQLPDKLYLQWQSQYSTRTPVWDDPLNQNLMQYDRIFEPVIVNDKIFIGFNDQDKVVALDLNSGKEVWHYYADGPVRLPLASDNGRIYFTSDDGNIYCLDANAGSLLWKVLLAPATKKLLGNKRLISMWPARGGVVIKDNVIYTSASIWPMMGTFIYALDAKTGDIIWKNEGTSDNYILQPHNFYAFAGIAPQGCFAISGEKLLVAGGRTVPGAFNLKTGEELYYRLAEGKQTGGSFICCNNNVFFNHNRERMTYMYDSKKGDLIKAYKGEYPVIDENTIYFSGKKITATSLRNNNTLDTLWQVSVPAGKDLIKAGNCLFAADSNNITAVKITDNKPQKIWTITSNKKIERLVAAQGKLIAVSDDGAIMVYGGTPPKKVRYLKEHRERVVVRSTPSDKLIDAVKSVEGYALVFGTKDPELLKGLISKTRLSIIAFEENAERIDSLREDFDNLGIKADRLAFMKSGNDLLSLPKYLSSVTIINDLSYLNGFDKTSIGAIYESLRPYGGSLWLRLTVKEQKQLHTATSTSDLYGADFKNYNGYTVITRTGSLKGSADWTHNYGNIANTIKSDDEIVKAPLGILWFGGNSNLDVLPRHGHGPGEQIIDGRLIIQGINSITARDVYTGRVIWQKVFDNLQNDTWQIYYDESYDEENPLVTKYNQEHLPGANARGTNFIATREFVYVLEGPRCHLIDISTGEVTKTFTPGDERTSKLAYIGVYKNYLIIGNNFSDFPEIKTGDEKASDKKNDNYDVTASKELVILNRFSGEKIWSVPSRFGFIHNSTIAGDDMLFCLDKLPVNLESKLKRRGEDLPDGSRLLILDINNGKILHQETSNIFGSWLGYSTGYKLLLQATAPSGDMLQGEDGKRMIVYNTVRNEILWDKPISYKNPPIIHNELIYTNGDSFSLLTGDPVVEKDFITGEDVKWNFKREYGCGYVVASEHLLTFRTTSAGFVNLESGEGTSNLGGFKAGCSANLIVADGVLNAPDYTRTCQCSYQNQTSLAFVNMPWMNYWTTSNYKWSGKPVKQLGLNLNAPGDRVSDNNTLWLDFPSVGGISPEIPVKLDTAGYYKIRKNPISINSEKTPWISASALGGIRSLEITLSNENPVPETSYRINLYFSELENKKAGERIFNVEIQNRKVLENFDIISEAGQKDKEIVKSFTGIRAGNKLTIALKPVKGNTILSGIEMIAEQ
jgi:outer membrane protein assembly factor BamB